MITYRQPLYITIKFLSIVGIFLCIAGIAGSWVVNGSLTNGISRGLSGLENILSITGRAFSKVDSSLIGIQEAIDKTNQGMNVQALRLIPIGTGGSTMLFC